MVNLLHESIRGSDAPTVPERPRMRTVTGAKLAELPQVAELGEDIQRDIRIVSSILPFKVNNYVLDQLIGWDQGVDDRMFRLTFPHRDMLPSLMYEEIGALIDRGAPRREIQQAAADLRRKLNPHPGAQLAKNIPTADDGSVDGVQHKYNETALLFPSQGQTCHSYCGYCFRWAQFVGMPDLKQQVREQERVTAYLRSHREISDVLFTGGDPMIMKTDILEQYIEPLLTHESDNIQNIRFGTKALSYWPYRFTTDADADQLLRLFERIVASGRHVAVMAHFSLPVELSTPAVQRAIRRILSTGAVIRAQAPIIGHVNDTPDSWAPMWRELVRHGGMPYYMFVERDTGAHNYFAVPLHQALATYQSSIRQVSGLERTARGPVMSAAPGKVVIDGITEVHGERVFVCRFLQARQPERVGEPFFARYDEHATWYTELRPASFEHRPWFAEHEDAA